MTFSTKMLISSLGLAHTDQSIAALLQEMGCSTKRIKLKRGEVDTALAAPEMGIDVVFSDPAVHEVNEAVPDGALVLSAVFFFSQGCQGHQQYQGDLPHGLTFGMTRSEVQKLLGMPEWTSPLLPIDRWVTGKYRTIVWFDEDSTKVSYVNCCLPDA